MDEHSTDLINIEIVCTLAAIGYIEENEYYKGEDCLECLKDVIRFLRNDDATCNVRRQLGGSEVVEKDLIPILRSCNEKEHEILEVCFRLLVNLTQPAIICFGKIPTEKMESNHYLEVTSHLQSYKQAFAGREVMAVIGRELGRLLQLEWDNRQEDDTLLIERILLLIRNILHVPADPRAEKRTDEDATVHDQLLWNIHVNGIDSLILYIASSPDESRWSMHALEIISHMLREQKADVLANTAVQRTKKEEDEETRQLDMLFEREKAGKKGAARKGLRHSNFGGTFSVQNMKALNDENKLLYHRPLQNAKKISFDVGKNPPRKRKKEVHARDPDTERKSTLSVRMFLKEFCCEFLENAYNPLMRTAKDNIKHQRAQQHDESYFLWAMRFFMEFNRKNNFEIAYISETLNVPIFQYVLTLQTNFFDNMSTDKKDSVDWARRLHLALRAYQELIQHLAAMERFGDVAIRDSAKVIKENVFYITEYRDVFTIMLKSFNPCCQTRSFLRDLIEAFHVFLKLLEGHCNGKGRIIVQQKKRKAKRKKKKNRAQLNAPPLTAEQIEDRWQVMSAGLSAVLQSEENIVADVANPFDPVSDLTEEEQKTQCLSNIQRFLREELYAEAVALLRAAREFWPNSSFGENEADPEDEFMCFYEIFRRELPVSEANEDKVDDEENEISDPEEEEMEAIQVRESEFDISDFLKKLASPKVLQPYCWLLNWYQENNSQVNHYIIKMLHRVAVDLKMPAMLFQLSLFVTFRNIFDDPASYKYKELVTFCKYILSKCFALLSTNPVLSAELLFWKPANVCYEIVEGYGSIDQRNVNRSGHSWTFEEEEELKRLYEQFKDSEDLVEDILNAISNEFRSRRQVVGKLITLRLVEDREILKKKPVNKNVWREEEENELETLFEDHRNSEDIVGSIIPYLSNQTRTRRQVGDKLVSLGLVEDREMLKKKPSRKSAWREEEENELRTLFEKFKDSDDIVDAIVSGLSNQTRTSRQVINQLVKLNIVEDRKTLRKKRPKKSRKNKETYEEESVESEGESDDDAEEIVGDQETDESSDEENEENLSSLLRNSEHTEQLEWIKARLRSAADDREEDDDFEPLPLVTLTEESELALRDRSFQKVLKKLGLVPPANEQERYWRIPGNLTPELLRKAVGDLEKALENIKTEVAKKNNPKRQKLAELAAALKSSDRRGERARKRKGRDGSRSTNRNPRDQTKRHGDLSGSERSEDDHVNYKEIDEDVEKRTEPRSNKKPRRKRVRMDSDDSDDQEISKGEEPKMEEDRQTMGNTDDSETGGNENMSNGNNGETSAERDEQNDKMDEAAEKESNADSDSSDDDIFDLPLARTKKKHVVLDDDDEDE